MERVAVFDHLYAILPEFGLRVFQQPSGADVGAAVGTYLEQARNGTGKGDIPH